jgi:TetR/AcrR family transcriptional regulator, repressor of the ameABC operon
MARPQTDIEAGRKLLLDTVDQMVRQRGAIDLSMSELALAAGMSQSNIYRFFESKEAVMEAVAEDWFADKIQVMEEVTASAAEPKEKMFAFFGRRFALMQDRLEEDPELFASYCALGVAHFEVVRGYLDLGDHYLAMIVAEAMDQGHFPGLSIDETVSLINQMVQPYCNPELLTTIGHRLSQEKLSIIIDTIFVGLTGSITKAREKAKPDMQLVS